MSTNPKAFDVESMTLSDAWRMYNAFLGDPLISFSDEPSGVEAYWRGYIQLQSFSTKIWDDAFLAALSRAADYELITLDKGFALKLQWGHDAGVVEDGPPSRPLRVNNLCIAPREVTDRIGSAYSRQIGRATEVFDHQPVLTRERGSCINLNLTTGLSKNFRSNSGETTIPPPRRSRRFRE